MFDRVLNRPYDISKESHFTDFLVLSKIFSVFSVSMRVAVSVTPIQEIFEENSQNWE